MKTRISRNAVLAGLAILSALLIVACGSSDNGEGGVKVSDAWARGTAPSQDAGAIYMTIKSDETDKLIKASVPTSVAGKTELHETVDTSGDQTSAMGGTEPMMGMRPVSSIAIPAGQTVMLEPGGYHVMLLDLTGPIAEGDTIPVTLEFENAGEIKVDATARTE